MSEGFRVREATPGDAAALAALAQAVSAEPKGWLASEGVWRSPAEERRYLKALRRYPHAAVFVAETGDGEVVGRLSVARDPHPASAHVADLGLMVAAAHRRRGIGRALLQRAVEWARAAGVRKLELHVFPHNMAAIALYESFGFRREGYRRGHFRRGDRYLDAVLMAYEVPPDPAPPGPSEGRPGSRAAPPRLAAPPALPSGLGRRGRYSLPVPGALGDLAEELLRPAVRGLLPYEPGKPVEELRRELGLERIVKLASNEGPYGPFPAAREAMARAAAELNRYPDPGVYRLRAALAERHGVALEEIVPGAGADGIVDCLSQALLDPGDEVVCGWPSFTSYPVYARKMGAVPRLVPLRDHRYDLEAMLEVVGPRTKVVYVCNPNNPTGTMTTRAELDAYFDRVPGHVLTVIDQAYFEYVDHPEYPDAVEEYAKRGRTVLVLRTFSKIYGLAGLRVGYGVGPAPLVRALAKTRRAFDVDTLAQAAALASLGDGAELERRRRLNAEGRRELEQVLTRAGLRPVGPAVANFLYADVGEDARGLYERLLREGVIVRPLHAFGAPTGVRVSVGTPDEHAFLARALERAVSAPAA